MPEMVPGRFIRWLCQILATPSTFSRLPPRGVRSVPSTLVGTFASTGPRQRVTGKATVPAMESGAYWGYVGLIEGLVTRIKAEDGRALKVVATGGLAPLFARATDCIEEVDLDLTLRGLLAVYRANRKASA